MKRLNTILFITSCFLFLRSASAQEFEKGNNVIDFDIKAGVYGDLLNVHNTTYSEAKSAVSGIYSIGYERAFLNWLGAGVQIRYDKYADSAGQKQSSTSFNVPFFVNLHVIRKKHLDLFTGISLGFSSLTIYGNDASHSLVSGAGSIFDIHIVPRFFFGGGHFGFQSLIPASRIPT